ncbi:protein of unknown function [Ruminococcaceae bacterium BL-6]|nr:protein of unknown function [Ruminococcaceae bacterium BL-6]
MAESIPQAEEGVNQMNEEIHLLEEALLNSIPAMQTVLLDGWVVRLNKKLYSQAKI